MISAKTAILKGAPSVAAVALMRDPFQASSTAFEPGGTLDDRFDGLTQKPGRIAFRTFLELAGTSGAEPVGIHISSIIIDVYNFDINVFDMIYAVWHMDR